jgi:hypothetical protein
MQNIARHSEGPKTQMKQDEEGEKMPFKRYVAIIRVPGNAPTPQQPLQARVKLAVRRFEFVCVCGLWPINPIGYLVGSV